MKRSGIGVVGLVVFLAASRGAWERAAAFVGLPAEPEALTAAALSARGEPSFVVLTDAWLRRVDPPLRAPGGLDLPVVDAAGRVVALARVPSGADERVFDEAPWGLAAPISPSPGYLERLARGGVDVRGVADLVLLRVHRQPAHEAIQASSAALVALLLGLPLALVGFAPAPVFARLARARRSPGVAARLAGALSLALAWFVFLGLCVDAPGSPAARWLAATAVALAGWAGVFLLVAPGTRLWPGRRA